MSAILFDLYGTLIDIRTDETGLVFWKTFTKKMKKYKGYEPNELANLYSSECKRLETEREEIDITFVFKNLFQVSEEISLKIAKNFRKSSIKYIRLYSGVKKLLNTLVKKGHHLYVLSNAQSAFTLPELKKLKIDSYFNGIAISSEYGVKKPNQNFFLKAIETFEIKEEEIIMIGNDFECDIQPAKELGFKTIFIESNLTPPNEVLDKIIGFNVNEILIRIMN